MYNSSSIDTLNRAAVSGDSYTTTKLNIQKTDDETKNIVSNTFGHLKNNIEALFHSSGLNENVTMEIYKISSDPNLAIEGPNGRVYRPQPLVGTQKPYNEMGNPVGGCFSMVLLG